MAKILGLMKHQEYALQRYADKSVIPLFFSVGSGKTLSATVLALEKYSRGEIDAVLVIAPNGIDKQWANQELPIYFRDLPNINPNWECGTMVYNNKKSKKPIPFVEGKLNFCCVNIDQFSTVTAYQRYVTWANAHRTLIIVDESTRIKNPKAKRTERLLYEFNNVVRRGRSIIKSEPKSVARIILTGTPATNGPFDLWSMFEFLRPNYFGINWYAFQNKYGMYCSIDVNGRMIRILIDEAKWKQIKACTCFEMANMLYGVTLSTYTTVQMQDKYQGPFKGVEELQKLIMEDAMFVRTEDVVDMPERTYIKKMIDMSAEQTSAYRQMENEMIAQYKDKEMTASSKLTMYLRLQQIASGFISTQDMPDRADYESQDEFEKAVFEWAQDPPPKEITWFDSVGKIDQLKTDMEEMQGVPLIIVTHFSAEAARIFDELTKTGHKCCLITGWKRVGTIEGFQKGEYDVMVANIRVISMGFNMQNAHHMIFYSNTFSLEDRIQVEGRIYRTGQKNTCIYIDYISADTIDMKVFAALSMKKTISDYIRDKGAEQLLHEWDKDCEEAFNDVVF